jgi:hypothetical protein
MLKKGQSAMEYLMTYGWAILIVIVVIAALYAMGVFTAKPSVTCSPCFSKFAFVDYSAGTLVITNGAQAIKTISAKTVGTTPIDLTVVPDTTADAGATITITSIPITGDVDINITYTVTSSNLVHTDTARIHN